MDENKPLTPKTTQLDVDNELPAGEPEKLLPAPKNHIKKLGFGAPLVGVVLILLYLILT